MKLHNMLPFRSPLFFVAAALWSLPTRADDLVQSFCSNENTGSDSDGVQNIYQSLGSCYTQCLGSYAFAVVQYQTCWCSNYFPASQVSLSSCNENCPGYPKEQCGNVDTGSYGYVQLKISPSGTAGASSSTSDQSLSTSSTSSTSSTTTAVPVTSVIVQTLSGAIVTQTVTTTPYPNGSRAGLGNNGNEDSGVSPGAVAGIVIGVVAGLAILALAAFLLWRRRKSQQDAENRAPGTTNKSPTRNVSVLSKAGLLNRTGPSMGERDHEDHFFHNPTGSNSVRHSILYSGADGVAPTSPLDSNHSNPSSRSGNKQMVYDQRLNPSALFANQEANGSRVSMQDQQDYSRPLGIANPDPRASFESRNSHHN